jgi:7-cyano-7-deazaguanine synthase in queuosine biosynthesis
MAEFDLRFQVPATMTVEIARTAFFWNTTGPSSFRTSFGPRLGALGPVRPANVDLVRIAAMVYAADRSVVRAVGRVNWTSRTIKLHIPVSDPSAWDGVKADLEEMLGFLSGDSWELEFRRGRVPREDTASNSYPQVGRVVLLSGGADSAAGAFLARTQGVEHLLISHVGATSISPVQKKVAEQIRALLPSGAAQHHKQVILTRALKQPGGFKLRNEFSTRTRSLLFLALGLAMASVNGVQLWIPENGFASLNPPLGSDQLGSLSTRTTHPWFLSELSRLAALAGAQAEITNPFADKTKGEVFRWVANELGDDDAAATFLSSTNSCANTNRRFDGVSAKNHCGVCFGCLMRRASFAAAGLKDKSTYVVDAPPNAAVAAKLSKFSIRPSIEGFVTRGLSVGDIAAMRLPAGYLPSAARALCERGKAELELLL